MSDGAGTKSGRDQDIFRTVRRKINGLSPVPYHKPSLDDQSEIPADLEASARELVGKIRHPEGDRKKLTPGRNLTREQQHRLQLTTLYETLDRENIPAAVDTIDDMASARNADAADILAILLEYPEETVRAHAAQALGVLGQRDSVEPLIRALDDKSPQVIENAAVALGEIGDNRAEIPLQKVPVAYPKAKRAAVNALARIESKRM